MKALSLSTLLSLAKTGDISKAVDFVEAETGDTGTETGIKMLGVLGKII